MVSLSAKEPNNLLQWFTGQLGMESCKGGNKLDERSDKTREGGKVVAIFTDFCVFLFF